MAQLIGRDAEWQRLQERWDQARTGHPQLVALWGRRRVGKTYLATTFAADRRHVYFTATRQDSEQRQVERYMARLVDQLGEDAGAARFASPTEWEAALRLTVDLARDVPLLVVLDEMPRLLHGRRDFADLLSAVWENHVGSHRLMMVVAGSAVSVMEAVLGADGGLRGRPTEQLRLDPFDGRAARAFLPDLEPDAFVSAYAACGGYPLHLRAWDEQASTEANLHRLAGSPGGLLLGDALDILGEDLDWRSGYERVLAAIGGLRGVRRTKIAGRAQQRIDYTLDKLTRAGYVAVDTPLGENRRRAPLYALADVYLAFWFTVLRDDADLIEGGQGRAVLAARAESLRTHTAAVFERLARAHAVTLVAAGKLPAATGVGRWWAEETVEIDVLGLADDAVVLVGEAKWQHHPFDRRQLHELRRAAAQVPLPSRQLQLRVWCPAGATEEVAAESDVTVHTTDELLPEP